MTFDVSNVALRLYRSNAVWVLAWVVFVLIAAAVFSIMYWDWISIRESNGSTILDIVLAAAAVIALPLAVWRSIVAAHQADTAQHGLLNERYQKGAEMLGSEELPVRLGGIYALARLAREYPGDYHTQIMSLLCAFVRKPPVAKKQGTYRREDVQAVMAAVCARSGAQIEIEKKISFTMHLSGADLHCVNLLDTAHGDLEGWDRHSGKFPDANFEGAMMVGTDLSGADLNRCKGLTQEQIDQAVAQDGSPPKLEGVVDANTGEPLVWRGGTPRG